MRRSMFVILLSVSLISTIVSIASQLSYEDSIEEADSVFMVEDVQIYRRALKGCLLIAFAVIAFYLFRRPPNIRPYSGSPKRSN